ncbi:hypothetical protein Tco_0179852, partial [Tanacetum coccineum]
MASLFTFKECLSYGTLHNKSCACSKGGFVGKFVRDPNKTPNSSQRPPHNCPNCGDPVDGLYCRQCALLQKKLRGIFDENEFFQDLLNPSESSNDKTNVVNLPQEPFVFNQDPGENSSQRPPHIDHHCCYKCGDSFDDIFCERCTCKSCGKGAHYGYNCPLKVLIISNPEPCNNQTVDELPQTLPSFDPTCYSGDGNSFTYDSTPNFINDSPNVSNPPPQPPTYSYEFYRNDAYYEQAAKARYSKIPICYDDDNDDESSIPLRDIIIFRLPPCVAITPVLSTEEPVDSLIMEDEHLDTIPATESDEVIKSSVEILVIILSESEGIPDKMCDVPFHDNSLPLDISKDQFEDFSDSNNDSTLIDDDSFSIDDIEYVEASPPDYELVSLAVVEIVISEVGGIDTDILLAIKDDVLREKLLNVNLLIAKIEALKDNPTLSSDFVTKSFSTSLNFFLEETSTFDNSLPESKTFCFNLEEINSGSPTSYSDLSLPAYEAFFRDSEPDSGDFTMDVVEVIFDNPTREPRVHVPNILPTHPTL